MARVARVRAVGPNEGNDTVEVALLSSAELVAADELFERGTVGGKGQRLVRRRG